VTLLRRVPSKLIFAAEACKDIAEARALWRHPRMDRFEMRRRSDGLVYVFERRTGTGRAAVYARSDGAVRVTFDPRFGWSILGDKGELLGRVWETPPEDQGDQPTLGLWVSCKGDKAYAYDLVDVPTG